MSVSDQFPKWKAEVKLLSNSVWQDAHINEAKIDQWLENFKGACLDVDLERLNAFHLLRQFIYYGKQEVYECLKVLFRDHFVYPTVQEFCKVSDDPTHIQKLLLERLVDGTRVVGVGHPAESGPSLLYHFRLANDLPTLIFKSMADLFMESLLDSKSGATDRLKHLIYFDDFCATGEQVKVRSEREIDQLKTVYSGLRVSYFILFATREGLTNVRNTLLFDNVEAAIVFDDDYKAFSANSHYYSSAPAGVDKISGEKLSRHYGSLVFSAAPMGYKECQLLVGFEHNTPDNTLPIIWSGGGLLPWHPIFRRIHKH